LETTMIYTHVLKQCFQGVVSPLEDLWLVTILFFGFQIKSKLNSVDIYYW
jgi:hypothetical protein